MISVRQFALYFLRAVGGFALARYLTRKQLRILCYHGFSMGDEHEIAPVMFMRAETFRRRMQILRRRRIPVIGLEEAVDRFQRGNIANAETVITLDDGWASNLSIGLPILEEYGYPACIYATTEHLAAGPEVFNVALSYMIRRSARETLTLEGLHPALDGTYNVGRDPDAAIRTLIIAAEAALPLTERQKLLRPIAGILGLDLEEVLSNDRFRLLTPDEFQELARRGVDIELHTHSHRLPDSGFEKMAEEIERNREALRKIVGAVPRHFCYPSGEYSERHPEWLKRLGIASATTCDPGLNGREVSVMLMKRFVDSDQASDIDFEAEVCGAREILRGVRGKVRQLLHLRAA
jgi:peptidoglycan/xylan/chitin deacetylase (PgdA/CDA1 family)